MSERLQPAFWGGLFIGVLSALPFVSAGNCCCCLWVVSGGVLAAYLRQQQSPFAIPASEGALVGLMAGLIGGVLGAVISIPMDAMMAPMQQRMMDWVISINPEMPAEVREGIEQASRQHGAGAFNALFRFIVYPCVGLVFGMLGGLLGVAIFKKNAPPPPPPPSPLPPLPPTPPPSIETVDVPPPPQP